MYSGVLLEPVVWFSDMEGKNLIGRNHNLSSMKGRTVNVNVSEFVTNLRTWNDAENVGSYVLR